MLRCVAPTEMNQFYWYTTAALVVKANVGNVASLSRTPIKPNNIWVDVRFGAHGSQTRACDCFSFVADVVALSAKRPLLALLTAELRVFETLAERRYYRKSG